MGKFNEFNDKFDQERQGQDIELTESIKRMVMSTCNVRQVLESWGVRPTLRNNQWNGYCPDHVLHDGHRQHLPKWSMNAETGDCTCFTSGKHSNFVYVAKRLYGFDTIEETIERLTNGAELSLPPPEFVVVQSNSNGAEERRIEQLGKSIENLKSIMSHRTMTDKCLEYFANDGIRKETLDALGVCAIESGYYAGRAIVPFLDEKYEPCGFVAINYMGKQWQVERKYNQLKKLDSSITIEKVEEQYKKTIYCNGFLSRNHLYGYYEALNGIQNPGELVLVEGERDAMKLLQEGIMCVSIHGTSLKDEQRVMLKKINPSSLYLGFDMDKPGVIASNKAYNALFGEIQQVYVLNFPRDANGKAQDPKRFCGDEMLALMKYAMENNVSVKENL